MEFLKPAHKQGKKFMNPVPTGVSSESNFGKVLWKYIVNSEETIPKKPLGPFTTDTSIYKTPPVSGLRITWVGHSSLLIEVDGVRLLTDPVWSKRASFSQSFGPKRFFAPPLALSELPPIDAIIISHDHYDHFDKHAIQQLAATSIPFYCSIGVGPYLQEWGVQKERITEMNWMDTAHVNNNCKLVALPARHFSGRSLTNRFETLWSSFAIQTGSHNIYFGADSGWYDGFYEIGEVFGPFDLTMLEIGAYNQAWADIHMGPANALKAHLALKGKVMMPIHWGTFNLALHHWREPVDKILQYAQENNVTLFLPKPGQPTEVTTQPVISNWWM